MSVVLIDWWSPEPHAEFNKTFYPLVCAASKLYVFNNKLSGLGRKCIVKKNHKNRIVRALSVFRICWKHRRSKLFFVSYDDVFLPFIQVFVKKIFCYEHNTTPERSFGNKHAVWQKLTFFTIYRCCQSKSQLDILQEMGQKCMWLGFPISKTVSLVPETFGPVFVFVSERFSVLDAQTVMPKLYGRVVAKKQTSRIDEISLPEDLQLDLVDRISIPLDFLNAEAVVVALESSVRGTGWYNEAITYGIPIIITSAGQQLVFETTYPNYPYIKGNTLKSKDDLKAHVNKIKGFDNKKYVKNYMNGMKMRLSNILN